MSAAGLEPTLQRVLGPVDLDGPSLSFLCSLLQEEVDFLVECPGSLSAAQLLHLLTVKLEETLVTYEVVTTEGQGRDFCARLIRAMQHERIIELAPGDEEGPAEEGEGAAASSPSSAASLLAAAPPKLSAPVRINDISRADAERFAASGFIDMAAIQRAKAPWSASEEAVLFQSLADSRGVGGDDDEEDEVVEEGGCAMCARDMPLTRHHLIPRARHKAYARMTAEQLNRCVLICRPCHSAVHRMEDEKTLAARFNTLPLIMADERMQKWVAYISKRRVNRTHDQAGVKGLHYGR